MSLRRKFQSDATHNTPENIKMTSLRKVSLLTLGLVSLGPPQAVAGPVATERESVVSAVSCRAADSTAVVRVANRFRQMLSTGDTAGLGALLAPDLKVAEGGSVENRKEYLSHHLSADIEFAKAVKDERTSFHYSCEGNVAWLVSTSTSTGTFGGRDINSVGAELMVLSRTPMGWKIRAIHWSSGKRQLR